MNPKEKEKPRGRGRGRRRVLAFIGDDEFKELVDKYGFSGAARKIEEIYKIRITKQSVRNEYKRRFGNLVSRKNIRDVLGTLGELPVFRAIKSYVPNARWIGYHGRGAGVDIEGTINRQKTHIEVKNWQSYDRSLDKHLVDKEIVSRFKNVGKGRKIVVFTAPQKFTQGAKKLLAENNIEVVIIGNGQIRWRNWDECFRRALKKFGELFGKFVELIDSKIEEERKCAFALVNDLLEAGIYDRGDDQPRVKSGLKSILESCGKVFGLVKGIGQNIGENIGNVSKYVGVGWKRFVIDESGRFGLVGKVMGGENLKKEDENLEDLVDRLLNGVAALSNSIKELVESVKRYNNEIGRLAKVSKKIEKMNKEIRKGVQLIKKRYRSDELAKAALEGADMSEIIKKLDNIGKIKRLERELAELEERSSVTIKEVLQKALQGEMTIGEIDELQRREAKKERLRRELAVLVEDTGSAGKKKKPRSEYHLVEKM